MPSRRTLKNQIAKIGWLADDETRPQETSPAVANAGRDVIERIRKCFARANHSSADEAEARAAFRMASRIMDQHDIQQSNLMEAEDQTERAKRGGMSSVNIWPAKGSATTFHRKWIKLLVGAVKKFFDCNAYSSHRQGGIEWTFYGVAEHTVSAAIAFEAIHNQIHDWAAPFNGVSTRNSYSLGISDGLLNLAEEEKKAIEDDARQYEARALAARIREEDIRQQVELHRLRQPSVETDCGSVVGDGMNVDKPDDERDGNGLGDCTLHGAESDVSDDEIPNIPVDFGGLLDTGAAMVDTAADFDTELQKFIVPESTPEISNRENWMQDDLPDENQTVDSTEAVEEPIKLEDTAEWRSMRQLSTYREMSKDIEASVLEAYKIKIRKGRKIKRSIKNREAYKKGTKDTKMIEVRAARIEHGKGGPNDDHPKS